jgi:hypothetical protein
MLFKPFSNTSVYSFVRNLYFPANSLYYHHYERDRNNKCLLTQVLKILLIPRIAPNLNLLLKIVNGITLNNQLFPNYFESLTNFKS